MTRKRTPKRTAKPETPAAFTRFKNLTRALLGVSKEEYDQKRIEHDREKGPTRSRKANDAHGDSCAPEPQSS